MGARTALPDFDSLTGIVGLPSAADPDEILQASQSRFASLIGYAAQGDEQARRDLVRLRLAYLNWAYAGRENLAATSATER